MTQYMENNMEIAIMKNFLRNKVKKNNEKIAKPQNLTLGEINHPYVIKRIDTEEKGMKDFLFTLGCFEGEKVTVISVLSDNYIIHVKDSRYSIDSDLAKVILI